MTCCCVVSHFTPHSDPGWGHRGQKPQQTWLAPKLSVFGRIWVPHATWKLWAQSFLRVLGHARCWPPPVGLGSALPLLWSFFEEQCWAGLGHFFLTPSGPRLRVGSSHTVPLRAVPAGVCAAPALAVRTLHGSGVS